MLAMLDFANELQLLILLKNSQRKVLKPFEKNFSSAFINNQWRF